MDHTIATQATERVIERLVYEGLLVHNQYRGRRWRVTLADLLAAGRSEPRILEVLPGILLHRPTVLYRGERDLRASPELQKLLRDLHSAAPTTRWRGLPMQDLRHAADRIAQLQRHQRSKGRWRNINIRVSEVDLQRLDALAKRAGRNKSDVVRDLIAQANS